jgi:Ca2+-binding RTX toxin-like protein
MALLKLLNVFNPINHVLNPIKHLNPINIVSDIISTKHDIVGNIISAKHDIVSDIISAKHPAPAPAPETVHPTTRHENFEHVAGAKNDWNFVAPPKGWFTDNSHGQIEIGRQEAYGVAGNNGNRIIELEARGHDASNLYTFIESTAGAKVTIQFDYSPRKGSEGKDSDIELVVDGKVIAKILEHQVGFKNFSFAVDGTGEPMKVEFRAIHSTNSFGGLLDNIKIDQSFPNQAPIAEDDMANGKQDTALLIPVSKLLANDMDRDGDTLVVSSVQHAKNGTVELIGNQVKFTPNAGYSGPASFTYKITDGKGGFDTATVKLNIEAVNQAPIAKNDMDNGKQDNALLIPVSKLLANDIDRDGDTLVITSVQNAKNGTVELIGSEVKFTPNAGYKGPASFTYTITDGKGGFDKATVNLTIAAAAVPVNQAPVAMNDSATGTMNNKLVIAPKDLLANDFDPEDGANGVFGVGLGNAVNGHVFWDGANVIFVPKEGYTGPASFTYTIADKEGLQSTATVNLTIKGTPAIEGTHQDDVLYGTDGNDVILGFAGNDSIFGGKGDDIIDGGQGNDKIDGGKGNDTLKGGQGNDIIYGGDGDDIIYGGQGNDVMYGGAGADTFVWTYNDIQPFGNGPETDIVYADFSDKLDLRDLLQNEQSSIHDGRANTVAEGLDNYLHFSTNAEGDTVMSVSALGSFADVGDALRTDASCIGSTDQTIIIKGIDLTHGGSISDLQVINNLLAGNHLITDLM